MELALLSRGEGLEVLSFDPESHAVAHLRAIPSVAAYEWSPNDKMLCYWLSTAPKNILFMLNCDELSNVDVEPQQIKLPSNISAVKWSPMGKFLLVQCEKSPESNGPQVILFKVPSGEACLTLSGRLSNAENHFTFTFGGNDEFLLRLVSDGLRIYDLDHLESDKQIEPIRITQPKIKAAHALGHKRADGTLWIAYCEGGSGSSSFDSIKVARVFLAAKNVKTCVTKAIARIQEVAFQWSPSGEHMVFSVHSDVDETGQSYYGTSFLFLVDVKEQGGSIVNIVTKCEGPIHACEWSKTNPVTFTVVYGRPPKIQVFNARQQKAVLSLGASLRNYIQFSVVGNLQLIAGFGNISGDADIWDMEKGKVVGMAKIPCTVECLFSPDAHYLLCSTTTPRLRVDNGIKILRVNGDTIYELAKNELYKASWRPRSDIGLKKLSPDMKFTIPKDNVYKLKGSYTAAMPNAAPPSRQLTAVKIESLFSPQAVPNAIPGLNMEDAKKSRKKTDRTNDRSMNAQHAAIWKAAPKLEFDIQEVVTASQPSIEQSTNVNEPVVEVGGKKNVSMQPVDLGSMPISQLEDRRGWLIKQLRDIEKLRRRKFLEPFQEEKVERFDFFSSELSAVKLHLDKINRSAN